MSDNDRVDTEEAGDYDADLLDFDMGAELARAQLDQLAAETPEQKSYPFGVLVAKTMQGLFAEYEGKKLPVGAHQFRYAVVDVPQAFSFRERYLAHPELTLPARDLVAVAMEYLLPPVKISEHRIAKEENLINDLVLAIKAGDLPRIESSPYGATLPAFCLWLHKRHPLQEGTWIKPLIAACRVIVSRQPENGAREVKTASQPSGFQALSQQPTQCNQENDNATTEVIRKQVEIAIALHSIRPDIPMVVCEKRVSKAVGDGSLPNVRDRKKYPDGVPRDVIEEWLELEARRDYKARQRKFSSDSSDYF